jgi:hypothetical protein
MTENKNNGAGASAGLNEFQARRLLVTCQYIDKLLAEVEEVLNAADSKATFPRFIPDVSPEQRQKIEEYISLLRAQLIRVLDAQKILREGAFIPATRAVQVALSTIDIALEELKPRYMRGYGEVPDSVAVELDHIVEELRGLVSKADRYVAEAVAAHPAAEKE